MGPSVTSVTSANGILRIWLPRMVIVTPSMAVAAHSYGTSVPDHDPDKTDLPGNGE